MSPISSYCEMNINVETSNLEFFYNTQQRTDSFFTVCLYLKDKLRMIVEGEYSDKLVFIVCFYK